MPRSRLAPVTQAAPESAKRLSADASGVGASVDAGARVFAVSGVGGSVDEGAGVVAMAAAALRRQMSAVEKVRKAMPSCRSQPIRSRLWKRAGLWRDDGGEVEELNSPRDLIRSRTSLRPIACVSACAPPGSAAWPRALLRRSRVSTSAATRAAANRPRAKPSCSNGAWTSRAADLIRRSSKCLCARDPFHATDAEESSPTAYLTPRNARADGHSREPVSA